MQLTACYHPVTYDYYSESALYSFPECQGTPCSKQVLDLKFKWQERDSNPQELSTWTNIQPFSQTDQSIKLYCEYLCVRCMWLYDIVTWCTSFRWNPHSIVCLNVKELLARGSRHIWSLRDSNQIRTKGHLIAKRTLKYLAKLATSLSCVMSIYLYSAFDSMLLSCHLGD